MFPLLRIASPAAGPGRGAHPPNSSPSLAPAPPPQLPGVHLPQAGRWGRVHLHQLLLRLKCGSRQRPRPTPGLPFIS